MNRLEGKVAIITGSGEGMGKDTAVLFAKEGARVAITCRREEMGKAVAEEIRSFGGEAEYFQLDVSKEDSCKSVVEQVIAKWGKIDILVNNAGVIGAAKNTHELTEEEWDQVFNIDVKGVLFMTKHTVPHMMEAKSGSIINFSSIYGNVASGSMTPYHAAKGAVNMMTKCDAVAYASYGIRVNSIHPACIITPLVHRIIEADPNYEASQLPFYPMNRLGQPDDVTYGVLYLASDESKFVTGTQLTIDGGYTAR